MVKDRFRQYLVKLSYESTFVGLLEDLYNEFGDGIFEAHSITNRHLDINAFSKKFFSKSTINEISADANANVNDTKNICQWSYGWKKGIEKLNGLYLIWKWVRKIFDEESANTAVKGIMTGDIFLNDMCHFSKIYSYYQETPIIIKINDEIHYITMKKLFETYEEFVIDNDDMEYIDLTSVYKEVDFYNCTPIEYAHGRRVKKFKKDVINQKIKVNHKIQILDKDNKWVALNRVLRHKNDKDFIAYQNKNGNFSIVTEDHPVILADGSEKMAKDLLIGDHILEGDIPTFNEGHIYVPNDMAYLIGFILGDGNVQSHKFFNCSNSLKKDDVAIRVASISSQFSIYQKDIKESKIYKVCSRLFGEERCIMSKSKSCIGRQFSVASVRFKLLLSYFFNLNGEKSFTKFLPTNILSWANESKKSLLSGLIDSDGTVNKNGLVNIILKSFSSVSELYEVLYSLNIESDKRLAINKKDSFDLNIGMFGISFRADHTDFPMCQKLADIKNCKRKRNSCNKRDNSISKVYNIGKHFDKVYSENVLEYAYDVTTESGTFYCNGMIQHNCYAFDLMNMLNDGIKFYGPLNIEPPQRSDTFINLFIQAVAYIGHHLAGAGAFPNFFACLAYFYGKEYGKDFIKNYKAGKAMTIKANTTDSCKGFSTNDEINYPRAKLYHKIKNDFQNIIYSLNFPFRGAEAPFTNLSIMDKGFVDYLFSGQNNPDGSPMDKELIYELGKIFYEYFTEINCVENVFTYPIITLAVSAIENKDGERQFIDNDFVNWVVDVNREKDLGNIFIGEPTNLSSCCFHPEQLVLTRDSNYGVRLTHFKDIKLKQNNKSSGNIKNFTIFHNGSWIKGKLVIADNSTDKLLEVTTVNNKVMRLTLDHLTPTLRGDIVTKDLTLEDYILFNTKKLNAIPENDKHLTYEQGVLIGAFLGDGSYGSQDTSDVNLSLNAEKYKILLPILEKAFKQITDEDIKLHLSKEYNNVYPTRVFNKKIKEFIKFWVIGTRSYNKDININCLEQSAEFREGIIKGWYTTDGGNSNRCYTTSEKLASSMEVILTSLGLISIIDVSDRTDEPVIIREQEFKRNYPLICVRWYKPQNKRVMKKIYIVKNNSIYLKIKSIKEISYSDKVYCFEMKNTDEPYFTLPNGIITHNCRLRSDLNKFGSQGYTNSFGVGGISVGSMRVCGINFPRMGVIEKKLEKSFGEISAKTHIKKAWDDHMDTVFKILYAHRKLIEDEVDMGVQPLITHGWIIPEKQYSTVGFIGAHEFLLNCGDDITTKTGSTKLHTRLKWVENHIADWEKKCSENGEKIMFNLEQIPGEAMAVRLADLDSILGYNNKNFKLYSNQYVPLTDGSVSMYKRIEIQGYFDSVTTGGSILHINIDGDELSKKQYRKILDTVLALKTTYFAFNRVFSRCCNGHITYGKNNEECPVCGSDKLVRYSRVVGFLTPINAWNGTRRDYEFPNRKFYDEKIIFGDKQNDKNKEDQTDITQ